MPSRGISPALPMHWASSSPRQSPWRQRRRPPTSLRAHSGDPDPHRGRPQAHRHRRGPLPLLLRATVRARHRARHRARLHVSAIARAHVRLRVAAIARARLRAILCGGALSGRGRDRAPRRLNVAVDRHHHVDRDPRRPIAVVVGPHHRVGRGRGRPRGAQSAFGRRQRPLLNENAADALFLSLYRLLLFLLRTL